MYLLNWKNSLIGKSWHFCDPMDSVAHSSMDWVAISSPRGSSWSRDGARVSCIGRWFFTAEHWGSPRPSPVFLPGKSHEQSQTWLREQTKTTNIWVFTFTISNTCGFKNPLPISHILLGSATINWELFVRGPWGQVLCVCMPLPSPTPKTPTSKEVCPIQYTTISLKKKKKTDKTEEVKVIGEKLIRKTHRIKVKRGTRQRALSI